MARLHFTEIAPASGKSEDSDQFEKFAKIFFEKVVGGKVTKGPTRGADGGIDLRVEFNQDGTKINKLISCKHYAHSKESVGISDECDIMDRLASFDCNVFVGFYSTIASTGLEQKLERLKNEKGISFEIFNSEDIETQLLEGIPGFRLAKRFFPKSIQNVWPQIISIESKFSESDAECINGFKWIIREAFDDAETIVYAHSPRDAARLANEMATKEIHEPMFLAAWKDAVKLYPDYFYIPNAGVDSAQSLQELMPNWDMSSTLDKLSPNPRWSLLAVWSLIDPLKVRLILKQLNHDASQQETDLMSFQWLAYSTNTERRDILTRLFAYHAI